MAHYLSIRVNKDLKEDFNKFCKKKGFTIAKAIKLMSAQFSKNGILPFSLNDDWVYLDKNEIRVSLLTDEETKKEFLEACRKYGIPMSMIVRGFMEYCVKHNAFPYELEEKRLLN